MPTLDIIKAWKDEEFRDTLTMEQKAMMPKHPSGTIEFQELALGEDGLFEGKFSMNCYTRGHWCSMGCTR